jgi:hypothetical protein
MTRGLRWKTVRPANTINFTQTTHRARNLNMPNFIVLDLNVSKTSDTGGFVAYANAGAPVVNSNPSGRVWWQSVVGSVVWTPVPAAAGSPPNTDGDPHYATPTLHNGDNVALQVVDLNPGDPVNKITSVQFAIVFGRTRNAQGQRRAPKASPFQSAPTANAAVKTTFIGQAVNAATGLWLFNIPQLVTYPSTTQVGPNTKATFSFYVGAVVTFGDNSQVQYGLDPEMEADDYSGGSK